MCWTQMRPSMLHGFYVQKLEIVLCLRMVRGGFTKEKSNAWKSVLCVLKTRLLETQTPPSPALTLVIAPTKSTDRFEWFLEKAMEMGVRTIQPVWTERSERRIEKADRWRRVLISALKQSQQAWLVDLRPACSWESWIADAPSAGFIAHCEEGERRPLFQAVVPGQEAWIAIGPEGDFTPTEIQSAMDMGAEAISLGENRLRTETAGLVAIHTFLLAQAP